MRTVDFTGTVSEATMRPQDVLPACMDVLAEYYPAKYNTIIGVIATEIAWNNRAPLCNKHYDVCKPRKSGKWYSDFLAHSDCDDADCPFPPYWQSEFISFVLNEDIWDAMQEIAPEGFYFGAHPGDGSDYGFWECEEDYLA